MAKVVILTGSPHNPGTSKQLADAFEKGAREAKNNVYRFDAGLQGKAEPHFLQVNAGEVGITDNDVIETEVIPHMLKADVIVLVSSLYYFGLNAQLKTVIDRMYDYNHQMKDKKSVVLVSAYGSQEDLGAVKLHVQKLQKYMRWSNVGSVFADNSWNQNKLSQFAEQAYKIGQNIK